jgi:hypothetical protein
MLIATRVLKLRRSSGSDIDIPVRIHAPEQREVDWACRIEVGWPDGVLEIAARGIDAVQALHLALQLAGAQIHASTHHASGAFVWLEPGKGYGFPITHNLRDLLVGDDKTL